MLLVFGDLGNPAQHQEYSYAASVPGTFCDLDQTLFGDRDASRGTRDLRP
jgi:hypothetical protein